MTFQEYASKLKFLPIESLPWEIDNEFDPPRKSLPTGIILYKRLYKGDGKYVLIGDDISGHRTQGCSCCSTDWPDVMYNYVGWTWALKLY